LKNNLPLTPQAQKVAATDQGGQTDCSLSDIEEKTGFPRQAGMAEKSPLKFRL
jgi:hypothetical protein